MEEKIRSKRKEKKPKNKMKEITVPQKGKKKKKHLTYEKHWVRKICESKEEPTSY